MVPTAFLEFTRRTGKNQIFTTPTQPLPQWLNIGNFVIFGGTCYIRANIFSRGQP